MLRCFLGYIGEFEYVDDHRAGKIVVELNGRLNKCGVISPRFDVGVKEIEGWTARLLPSRQVSQIASFTFSMIVIHRLQKNIGSIQVFQYSPTSLGYKRTNFHLCFLL